MPENETTNALRKIGEALRLIDWKKFVADEAMRFDMTRPWYANGYLNFTNGKMIVRVAWPKPGARRQVTPDVGFIFSKFQAGAPSILPIHVPCSKHYECPTCDGKGTIRSTCPDCDDYIGMECPRCKGKPVTDLPCESCLGDGKLQNRIVAGSMIDPQFFRLIARLPGCRFLEIPKAAPEPVYFIWDLGNGAVMPTTYEGDE